MPEGGPIPPKPGGGRVAQDRRERLLIELAGHMRAQAQSLQDAAKCVEALAGDAPDA